MPPISGYSFLLSVRWTKADGTAVGATVVAGETYISTILITPDSHVVYKPETAVYRNARTSGITIKTQGEGKIEFSVSLVSAHRLLSIWTTR